MVYTVSTLLSHLPALLGDFQMLQIRNFVSVGFCVLGGILLGMTPGGGADSGSGGLAPSILEFLKVSIRCLDVKHPS